MLTEITILTEDLSKVDCGGGMREVKAVITIDTTQSLIIQMAAVAYEILASHLDSVVKHEDLEDIATQICEAQEEIRGKYERL